MGVEQLCIISAKIKPVRQLSVRILRKSRAVRVKKKVPKCRSTFSMDLYLYIIFDQRRLDINDQVELWSPRQVTRLPRVGYFTSPGIDSR